MTYWKFFTEAAEFDKGAKHKVFKGRFDSKEMVNSAMFREKLNYIHNNPCALKRVLLKDLKIMFIQAPRII